MKRLHELEKQAMAGNIGITSSSQGAPSEPSTTETGISKLWRMSGAAGASSFRGRVGIYEVLTISPEIQKLIVGNSTSELLQQQAISEGMITMQTDGFIKSLRGQTTLEEVMRVTSER